jgi:GGDEF domain-containing protein
VAFDDLRESLAGEIEREPGSPLLVRASFERLLAAFATRAQQTREALGLVAFELEDWKGSRERAGASAFASAFAGMGHELRRRVRASDELGRLGEGQLAAVLPGCDEGSLDSVSKRLRLVLESRELALGGQSSCPTFVTAWLAAPLGPTPASAAGPLDELGSALERARDSDPS